LWLGYEQRPRRDQQAFLGELGARVQPWGISDLLVILDVDAPDMGAALSRTQELVVNNLGGNLLKANVVVPGFEVRPGRWWQRRRDRR
jgi:hypothetical protein